MTPSQLSQKKQLSLLIASALTASLLSQPVVADSFTIKDGEVVTTNQTLSDNETGTIDNGGELNVTGTEAIKVNGDSIAVNNGGSITSTDTGLLAAGANISITNSGSIEADAAGIFISNGVNSTISNSGSITSNLASGILVAAGSNAFITNSGNIAAENNGIDSDSGNDVITNSGNITAGDNGIDSSGANVAITNSGDITAGDKGIKSDGDNATITNSGTIIADDSGINLNANAATISNSGTIIAGIRGINSYGANAIITNSGSITADGKGISSYGTNATITNSGSIVSTGDSGIGILAAGSDATITNSGLISATGKNSFALTGGSGNNDITLNLESGSRIIGRIDLGGDNTTDTDTVNISGGSISAKMTFENTEVVNLINGAAGVVTTNGNDKTVTTVDTTGESSRGIALAGLTSDLHNVINQRLSHDAPLKPVKVASLELSSDMVFSEHQPEAWVQAFGGRFERDNDGSALAYDHTHVGISFGYDFDLNNSRFGIMGGYASTRTDTDVDSFKTDADNFFIGLYNAYKLHGLRLSTALVTGFGQHDNRRTVIDNLAGIQTAKSDFNSRFISPSIGLSSAYKVNDTLELRPSINLNYSIAWLGDYTETGTTNSNLSVDDRKAKAFTAKAQLEAAYQITSAYELAVRAGVNSRHTDDDQTKVSLAGNRFNFANSGDDSVTGGFVGFHLSEVTDSNLKLVADIEVGGASKEHYINGSVSLNYTF